MKLDGETAHKIASGKVTVLIRPLSKRPPANRRDKLKQIIPRLVTIASARNVNRSTDPEYLWKREKVLMVHAHANIVSERVRLDELAPEDIAAAGHPSLLLFRSWFGQNVGKWRDDREVWVIRFTIDNDRPQWLVNPVWGVSGDYSETYDPRHAVDDLEAVTRPPSLHGPQARARERFDRQMLSTEARLERVRAEARRIGVDLTRQEQRALDAMKRSNQGGVVASIESMERKIQSKAA